MKKILIFEDEPITAIRTQKLIEEIRPDFIIENIIDSIEDGINWINTNGQPDLMFLDIQLADGHSFELFKKINITCPVIFITAFENYMLQAFKVFSIDYLLKPINKTDLKNAIDRFINLESKYKSTDNTALINQLISNINQNKIEYKQRFLVKYGDTYVVKLIHEIAYFFASEKLLYLVTKDARKYIFESNLENLESLLDPNQFFRINRKIIISIDAIIKVKNHISRRLQVFVQPNFEQDIFVSKEKSSELKNWLDSGHNKVKPQLN